MEKRKQAVDIVKGILIILVVVAHAKKDMPLFFMISGLLMSRERLLKNDYVAGKIKSLMMPYGTYLVLDLILVRKTISVHDLMYAIWGGRAVTGVYWYITCFLFTLLLFSTLLKKFYDNMVKPIILIGGGEQLLNHFLWIRFTFCSPLVFRGIWMFP